jgi:hypothetical protein
VGTWAARTSWRTAQSRESNGQAISYVGNMLLRAATYKGTELSTIEAYLTLDGVTLTDLLIR